MSDTSIEPFITEMYSRPLKKAGSREIEAAIQKAISDMAGQEYEASVSYIDFDVSPNSSMGDDTQRLRKKK